MKSALRHLLPAAAGILLCHCTTTPVKRLAPSATNHAEVLRKHSINIDGSGTAFAPEALLLKGKTDLTHSPAESAWMNTNAYKEQLDQIFAELEANPRCESVLIFIHGGLTNINDAAAASLKLHDVIEKDTGGKIHPIFINWETGLAKSYGHHLAYDRAGISHDETGNSRGSLLLAPLALIGDLGTGISRAPLHLIMSFGKDLQNVEPLYDRFNDRFPTRLSYERKLGSMIKGPVSAGGWYDGMGGPSLAVGADDQGGAARKVRRWVTSLPVKVTSSLLLDSVGTPAWDNMMRRTQSIFRPSRDYVSSGTRQKDFARKGFNYAAGNLFFERFSRWSNSSGKKVILVGHSMGSIVLNEMFRLQPKVRADDVVYMGAACSIADFNDSAGRYLADHPTTQFYNLCLHPRAEVDEDHLTIRGSLLVWLDNYFEGPRHFTSRTLGSIENAVIAYNSLPHLKNIHLKAFTHDGKNKRSERGPQTHGGFADYAFWRPEYWTPPLDSAVKPTYKRHELAD